ncbi:MAG: glycosyltransferase [Gemmatimonadales bacterium]|nr:MAG: glycosyltransferase [Gemmatimonadales bacterium]
MPYDTPGAVRMADDVPEIAPLSPTDDRPLWSVMIPTYEGAATLGATLESVLAQDPGPAHMQIEVVDDHSTVEDSEALVREIGRGRVGFFRQPQNVGHTANFNTCITRAQGKLVHLLHGDDAVRDGFYARMEKVFSENPDVGAAFCRMISFDSAGRWRQVGPLLQLESGILEDPLAVVARHQPFQSPCTVVRRAVYEQLGGYNTSIRFCGEDWDMGLRVAGSFPLWYEVDPLALRRHHSDSLTGRATSLADNSREMRRIARLAEQRFPAERRTELTAMARQFSGVWATGLAWQLVEHGDRLGALRQLRQAILASQTPRVLARIGLILSYWIASPVIDRTLRTPPLR